MKKSSSFAYVGLFALVALLAFSLTAWNQNTHLTHRTHTDTVPRKGDHKTKDIDEAIAELDRAMEQLDKELKKPLPPVPPADIAKMKAEIERSLKDLDPEKMKADMEAIKKEVDAARIKADVEASLSKVDMEKVRVELERVKNEELPKIEAQLKKMGPEIEASMKKAKESVEKARREIQEYKGFIDGLEKDGLIDRKQDYRIEHEDGVLKINGKVQPAGVYNKYKAFLEKHKDFTIKKEADDFNIDVD
jgi:chromosome segregation ATPase